MEEVARNEARPKAQVVAKLASRVASVAIIPFLSPFPNDL
jgi:hypothetical protein